MTKGPVYKLYEKLDDAIAMLRDKKLTLEQRKKIAKKKKELNTLLNKK